MRCTMTGKGRTLTQQNKKSAFVIYFVTFGDIFCKLYASTQVNISALVVVVKVFYHRY